MDGHGWQEEAAPMLPGEEVKGSGLQYLLNLLLMSFAFLGIFAAFNSTQNLESSLIPGRLGYWSIAGIYISFCFGALFIAPLAVKFSRPKYALIGGALCYSLFMAANLWPMWGTMMPAAGILGIGASVLWAAQGAYLTASAAAYAEERLEHMTSAMGTFNGIFWAIFQAAGIIGNLLSALVLSTNGDKTHFLFYIFLGVAGAGTFLLFFLRPAQKGNQVDNTPLSQRIFATLLLMKDKKMIFLIPILFYSGLEQAFAFGDFTSHLINETKGKQYIGYVMAVFGAVDAVSSFVFGKLADKIPRIIIVGIGFVAHFGFQVFWWIWLNNWQSLQAISHYPYVLFITAGVYGVGDAVWNTFTSTMMSFYFTGNSEAAFSNLKLFNSLGYAASFIYGPLLPFWIKQVILCSTLIVSVANVVVLDRFIAPLDKNEDEDVYGPIHVEED